MTAGSATETDEPGPEEVGAAVRRAIEGDVRVDAYTRHLYASDASMYAIEPLAVAFPRHAADVSAIVRAAGLLDVPVLARGAGTSLAGQAVCRAIVVDFSRHLNRVLEVDPAARLALVEPGVVQEQLNDAVAGTGLMFAPDTSTSNRATIGGMIGNNSAGSHSVRYGSTIDHINSVRVVLSDANSTTFAAGAGNPPGGGQLQDRIYRELPEIISSRQAALATFPAYWRHSGGYRIDRAMNDGTLDLTKVIVGSEGTLALVTAATVALIPRPRARAIAVGHFDTVEAAVAATDDALALDAALVELMDGTILRLSRERVEYARLHALLEGNPAALIFVEFVGDQDGEVAAKVAQLSATWAEHGHGTYTLHAKTAEQQAAVLNVRKASLGLLMAAGEGTRRPLAFVEDTAVPPHSLVPYIREFREILDRYGMQAGFYGHCSVGCLHIRPFVDVRKADEADAMRTVAMEIADLVTRYGGVNSSEHGDGLARSEFNRKLFGRDLYTAMREVKQLFDPHGRFNPGKIVDAPPMTESLRDAALGEPRPLLTIQSFSTSGGMRGAADRCMNIGACRKQATGVMCPSFMVTREEEHSTRGRANALVKALSEPDPEAAMGEERLHGILDLCVGCKACKSECPLGVDMAALKSEALYHYNERNGTPLRTRLLGRIRTLNRVGSRFAPLSNWPGRLPLTRRLLDRGLGITRHRPLPQFHRANVLKWFATRTPHAGPFPRGDLVLLADSFTTYSEPSIGIKAVELLEAAGWRVRLTGNQCCGRASISNGRLPQAVAMADTMLATLAPYAERGVPIVGLEPSCLVTLRDDYARLRPDDGRVATVAGQARLIQECLLDAIAAGDLTLDPASPLSGRRILVHAHCHEKAIIGAGQTMALLNCIPGADIVELDAGCCGMAGSFGFESEHYEVSMQIGELRLFPQVQAAPADTIIAATGSSCRQQIAHGTQRTAQHPVELIHSVLASR